VLLAISLPIHAAQQLDPAAIARIVGPFVDSETIAVEHIDISRISPAPVAALLKRAVPDAGLLAWVEKDMTEGLAALRRDQVTDLCLIVSLGGRSVIPRVSLLVFPAEPKRNLDALRSALGFPAFVNVALASDRPNNGPPARPELAEALEAAGDAAAQIVLIPPASSRRVIEELMPQVPPQLGGGPSTMLTHGISWAAAAIEVSPRLSLRLTVKSQDAQAAEALRAKWLDVLKLAGQENEIREMLPKFDEAVALLTPKLLGDRLSLAIGENDLESAGLFASLPRAADHAREAGRRATSMNNLGQIALAMRFYYSTAKHFPPPASRAPDGKPLLSWRVAILQYTEYEKLYREFHLDEPWDSPHNKSLIERMPVIFHSPKSKAAKGLTNYLVPVGGGALYSSSEDKPTLKDISDGESHTIMLVEVDDQHAVTWTKPDDMPFDPQDPKKGIGSVYREGFPAAFCDGSCHLLGATTEPKKLKALFTRAAGDPFWGY